VLGLVRFPDSAGGGIKREGRWFFYPRLSLTLSPSFSLFRHHTDVESTRRRPPFRLLRQPHPLMDSGKFATLRKGILLYSPFPSPFFCVFLRYVNYGSLLIGFFWCRSDFFMASIGPCFFFVVGSLILIFTPAVKR